MTKKATLLSALVLAVVSFLHLLRVMNPVPIIIGDYEVPVWVSGLVFVFAGFLSVYLFSAVRRLP